MRIALAVLVLVAASSSGCFKELIGGLQGAPEPTDYLRADPYTKWVIEVDFVNGMKPEQSAFDLLKTRMDGVANKPDGIAFEFGAALPATNREWSSREVLEYAEDHLDQGSHGNTVVTHLLFLDGKFSDPNVLGVAIGHGTVALFSEVIRDVCTTQNLCFSGSSSIFQAVMVHEFGHAIGLVNHGIAMKTPHEDTDHPGHSSNRNSVMYYAVETSDVLNILTNGPPTTFDADDRADVCQAGGKC